MSDATILARVLAMQAEMYQIVATIEGMKALNQWREMRGEAQAYGEESFVAQSNSLGYLAGALREIGRG
jgi:hypothetical protein